MSEQPEQTSPQILQYSAKRSRFSRPRRLFILVFSAYLLIYSVARVTRIIIHYESVVLDDNWWWRDNAIGPGEDTPVPRLMLVPLKPLMVAEELLRGAASRVIQ